MFCVIRKLCYVILGIHTFNPQLLYAVCAKWLTIVNESDVTATVVSWRQPLEHKRLVHCRVIHELHKFLDCADIYVFVCV